MLHTCQELFLPVAHPVWLLVLEDLRERMGVLQKAVQKLELDALVDRYQVEARHDPGKRSVPQVLTEAVAARHLPPVHLVRILEGLDVRLAGLDRLAELVADHELGLQLPVPFVLVFDLRHGQLADAVEVLVDGAVVQLHALLGEPTHHREPALKQQLLGNQSLVGNLGDAHAVEHHAEAGHLLHEDLVELRAHRSAVQVLLHRGECTLVMVVVQRGDDVLIDVLLKIREIGLQDVVQRGREFSSQVFHLWLQRQEHLVGVGLEHGELVDHVVEVAHRGLLLFQRLHIVEIRPHDVDLAAREILFQEVPVLVPRCIEDVAAHSARDHAQDRHVALQILHDGRQELQVPLERAPRLVYRAEAYHEHGRDAEGQRRFKLLRLLDARHVDKLHVHWCTKRLRGA
mmetsp:Transcript_55721/g.158688  ORF Transcript_55721/g.158688 Transcript_55721/m.158688 type:complete len:401 (+) Transcript_55721:2343-3545(+)